MCVAGVYVPPGPGYRPGAPLPGTGYFLGSVGGGHAGYKPAKPGAVGSYGGGGRGVGPGGLVPGGVGTGGLGYGGLTAGQGGKAPKPGKLEHLYNLFPVLWSAKFILKISKLRKM
ncbi:hypothetical protein XENOCAPTIV_005871 [Xenoophorus captivus]|uniref:Elastin n=1 Tax=Xenoophorus captivus TaxID=1517983 RepID=A0ABV0R7H4_9TELE